MSAFHGFCSLGLNWTLARSWPHVDQKHNVANSYCSHLTDPYSNLANTEASVSGVSVLTLLRLEQSSGPCQQGLNQNERG